MTIYFVKQEIHNIENPADNKSINQSNGTLHEPKMASCSKPAEHHGQATVTSITI